MPGVRIKVDTDQAIASSKKLRQEMGRLGRQTRTTEGQAGKVERAFVGMGATTKRLASSVLSLKGAFVGLAGTYGLKMVADSFVDAASTAEQYRVRLTALLGSQEKGNLLFQKMADYAGRVPFQYEEIMGAATALSGVMRGGVSEIEEWMPMIGDLAAVSGLGIEQTTSQIIRMYSAGAAAADMFRERGILAMLGFQAGVKYSTEETREMLMKAWLDPQSQFRDATKDLAKTWEGLMSMMSDKWFQFRNLIMEAGIYDALKEGLIIVNNWLGKWIENNKELIQQKVHEAVKLIVSAVSALRDILGKTFLIIGDLWAVLSSVPRGALEFLDSLEEASAEANENIKELNKSIKGLTPPELTTWQKFWSFMDEWGQNIVRVFAFMGEAIGAIFAGIAGDAIESVKIIGKEFWHAGTIIWNALSFNFDKVKEEWGHLVNSADDFNKNIQMNWTAMTETLLQNWMDMLKKMEGGIEKQPVIPGATVAPGGETPLPPPPPSPPPPPIPGSKDVMAAWTALNEKASEHGELIMMDQQWMEEGWEREKELLMEKEEFLAAGRQAQLEAEWSLQEQVQAGVQRSYEHAKIIEQQKVQVAKAAAMNMMANWAYAFEFFGQRSEAFFKLFKVISIAETVINTYAAAQAAYKAMAGIPIVGPTLAVAAAAAAVAAGMARVAQISAMEPGGGVAGAGGGGGGTVGTYPASPTTGLPEFPEAEEEKKGTLTINIHGDVLGDESFIQMLADRINEGVDNRDVYIKSTVSRGVA